MPTSYHPSIVHSGCGRDIRDCMCTQPHEIDRTSFDSREQMDEYVLSTLNVIMRRLDELQRDERSRFVP